MGLFSRGPRQVTPPPARSVPQLWPEYYESIQRRLVDAGGTASVDEVASAVANAIFNTGTGFLSRCRAVAQTREFESRFGTRTPQDHRAADEMIDYLISFEPSVQDQHDGWIPPCSAGSTTC